MYIPELRQQLQILSREEAESATRIDHGHWNVISIHSPRESRMGLGSAKRVFYACFDDVEEPFGDAVCAGTEELAGIVEFAHSVKQEPLIIHCQMGISRSTAVALALVYHGLANHSGRVTAAVDILLRLRPIARPNKLVLKLALQYLQGSGEVGETFSELLNHPRFQSSRF